MPETYTREIIKFMNALNASTLGLYKNKVFSRIEVTTVNSYQKAILCVCMGFNGIAEHQPLHKCIILCNVTSSDV